jgi:hypothetical protein
VVLPAIPKEPMNFDDVKKQLQAKKLNLGLWLQAVIDGEVTPFKLRPTRFTYDIENTRLAHFAFHRDQIRQYLSRHCPELNMPATIFILCVICFHFMRDNFHFMRELTHRQAKGTAYTRCV